MGDALVIEARAQCRLADEYDAAQERGEVAKLGGHLPKRNIPNGNTPPTVTDIGLTSKQVHEARIVRDADKAKPGIVRQVVEEKLKANEEPTRADVKRAVSPKGPKSAQHKHRNPEITPEKEQALAKAVLDQGKTLEEAVAEFGLGSVQIAKVAVAKERGRRETQAEIDPATLSLSAQEKLESAIRQEKRKLAAEFHQAVNDEIKRAIDETVLPQYIKEMADARQVVESRKGVFSREDYKLVLSCLHPDNSASAGRRGQAFNKFKSREISLCKESEMPTTAPPIPRTYTEMMKRRAEVQAARRANRSNHNVQRRA